MKMNALLKIAVATALLIAAVARAPAQGAAKRKGFDDFQLLKTRNIFDPNRRASRIEPPRDSRATSTRRIPRANTLSLTGTMVADGRALAFLNGSRSEYSKVIGVGETVADYKVKAIDGAHVELEHNGKATVLGVGKLLTLEGTTEVAVDGAAEPEPEPDATAAAAPDAAAAPAAAGDKNDVLRRMMERRAKEMNK
jgi:hypothetical protein